MTAAPGTLDELRRADEAELYPADALDSCADALLLFAAGFYGRQDAVWVADAGLTGTCVDIDGARLERMRPLYPDGWEFVCSDAFVYAAGQDGSRRWDVVSLDPPTSLFDQCAAQVPVWVRLARRAVIMGCGPDGPPKAPTGWKRRRKLLHRSDFGGGVYWAVLEKADA